MRFVHRRRTAAAVAAAVLGGLLCTGQGALAVPGGAPGGPRGPAPAASPGAGAAAAPAVWPRPRSIRAAGRALPLRAGVRVVAGAGADPYAVGAVRDALTTAGVPVVRARRPVTAGAAGTVVLVGGTGARDALRALHAPRSAPCRPGDTASWPAGSRGGPPSPSKGRAATASSTPPRPSGSSSCAARTGPRSPP